MELKTISDVEKSNLFPDDRFNAIMQQTQKVLQEHSMLLLSHKKR